METRVNSIIKENDGKKSPNEKIDKRLSESTMFYKVKN